MLPIVLGAPDETGRPGQATKNPRRDNPMGMSLQPSSQCSPYTHYPMPAPCKSRPCPYHQPGQSSASLLNSYPSHAGARGETKERLESILAYPPDLVCLHAPLGQLLKSKAMSIASKLFVRQGEWLGGLHIGTRVHRETPLLCFSL